MTEQRRPISTRDSAWAQTVARLLASKGFSPNGISKASIVFAFIGSLGLLLQTRCDTGLVGDLLFFLLTVLGIQGRLICNLLDGMVAIEHGKKTRDGGFWNEFPDRISDIVLFVAFGYSLRTPEIGFVIALLSLLTAYIRVLGEGLGVSSLFIGPGAKQHRMAFLTLWSIVYLFLKTVSYLDLLVVGRFLGIVISVLVFITCVRRASKILSELHERT